MYENFPKIIQAVIFAACIFILAACITLICTGPLAAQENMTEGVPVVLAPRHESVLAAEIDSRVEKILKEFGQSFRRGTVLVQLDAGPAGLEVRRAKALLEEARKEFTILQDLYQTKSVSILELEDARSKQIVAEVDLTIARQKLARCTVKAPFAGRVCKLMLNEYEWVKIGTPLMKIVDDSVLLAKFLLPSSMYGHLKTGNKISVIVQETGRIYKGKISHIGAEVDPSSRSFEVFAEVKNDSSLRSGMRGTLLLQK